MRAIRVLLFLLLVFGLFSTSMGKIGRKKKGVSKNSKQQAHNAQNRAKNEQFRQVLNATTTTLTNKTMEALGASVGAKGEAKIRKATPRPSSLIRWRRIRWIWRWANGIGAFMVPLSSFFFSRGCSHFDLALLGDGRTFSKSNKSVIGALQDRGSGKLYTIILIKYEQFGFCID
jgi:hypothetical protein